MTTKLWLGHARGYMEVPATLCTFSLHWLCAGANREVASRQAYTLQAAIAEFRAAYPALDAAGYHKDGPVSWVVAAQI